MAAFGTTTREEQFSISANIWIDSPREEKKISIVKKIKQTKLPKQMQIPTLTLRSSADYMDEKLSYEWQVT